MNRAVILDTGPLITFLARGLKHHDWVRDQWRRLRPPLITCEPVLTEAAFLLKREGQDTDPIFALLERGIIRIGLEIQEQQNDLRTLMKRYRNRPMSLADASIVRLSEMQPETVVFTMDSDFHIYRRHGNKVIPLLIPDL